MEFTYSKRVRTLAVETVFVELPTVLRPVREVLNAEAVPHASVPLAFVSATRPANVRATSLEVLVSKLALVVRTAGPPNPA